MKKRIIKVLMCILGIGWLAVTMYFGINMFMGMDSWLNKLLLDRGVETNAKFTGGDPTEEITKENYTIVIHEPVYEGVFISSKKPFIQVDWLSHSQLPPVIEDTLDVTGDGDPDITVRINTTASSVEFESLREDIKGLLDKGSLADIRAYSSKNSYDGLFSYHNKSMGDTKYENGVSIRIMFDRAIE